MGIGMMEVVVQALGMVPSKRALLQKLWRDGSFHTEGGMSSSPGDFEEFKDLSSISSSRAQKGLQLIGRFLATRKLKNGAVRSGVGCSELS